MASMCSEDSESATRYDCFCLTKSALIEHWQPKKPLYIANLPSY